jgi:hypothetical protein
MHIIPHGTLSPPSDELRDLGAVDVAIWWRALPPGPCDHCGADIPILRNLAAFYLPSVNGDYSAPMSADLAPLAAKQQSGDFTPNAIGARCSVCTCLFLSCIVARGNGHVIDAIGAAVSALPRRAATLLIARGTMADDLRITHERAPEQAPWFERLQHQARKPG